MLFCSHYKSIHLYQVLYLHILKFVSTAYFYAYPFFFCLSARKYGVGWANPSGNGLSR